MKKGFLSVFSVLIVLMVGLLLVPTAVGASALDLSEIQPSVECEIYTAEDYLTFVEFANNNSTDGYEFVLMNSIDLTSYSVLPVGNPGRPFDGTFDGRGNNISADISGGDYVALFGYLGRNATVRDLIVSGNFVGESYVAAVVGYNMGTVSEVMVEATVSGTARVGTAVGYNLGTMDSAITVGTVSGTSYVGGIVGESVGVIEDCTNISTVSAKNYGGGITGKASGEGYISSCINIGNIECGSEVKCIGGIVGEISQRISDCYNYAGITAGGESVGSAVGLLSAAVSGSGRVYNVGSRSVREVVDDALVTIPDGFTTATEYQLLAGEELFSEGTLVRPSFDVGYGYLTSPVYFAECGVEEVLSLVRIKLFSAGEGTESDPFVISDVEDWELFSDNVDAHDYSGVTVRLDADLELGSVSPLGLLGNVSFGGAFLGNGKRLSFSNADTVSGGLFYALSSTASVERLTLDVNIVADSYVGGLAGKSEGNVSSVTVTGNISGESYVGGIVGSATGSITDCENRAILVGNDYVGGILGCGENLTALSSVVNYAKVSIGDAATFGSIGGVAGKITGSTAVEMRGLYNFGEVSAYKAIGVGGIVGTADGLNINDAFVTANVTGRIAVGGIVGDSIGESTLTKVGTVAKVNGASYRAGLVGRGIVDISSSYFSGTFGIVNEATVDETTCSVLANPNSTFVATYYNSDLVDGVGGEGASYVKLTGGILSADGWLSLDRNGSYGVLPLPNDARVYGDVEVMAKCRYDYFGGGQGTDVAPYLFGDEQQYRNMMELLNTDTDYVYCHFSQTADITFVKKTPCVGAGVDYYGTLDGRGYTLSNVDLASAMFSSLIGTVKNVGIESGKALGSTIAVGIANVGKISNCYSLADVSGNGAGGIADSNWGTIENSVCGGRVVSETHNAGGIVLYNSGTISSCVFFGYVEGKKAGGVAASNSGNVEGTVVNGTINGTGDVQDVGGYFGDLFANVDQILRDGYFAGVVTLNGVLDDTVKSTVPFLAGSLIGVTPTIDILFNKDVSGIELAYYTDSTPIDGSLYARTTTQMLDKDFVNELLGFNLGGERDEANSFAPISNAFSDDRIGTLAKEGSKIALFGKDYLSAEKWGSERNPYLISSAQQFSLLSDLTKNYDYTDKYFRIESDLDFSSTDFSPIGVFYGSGNEANRPFNGNIDGNFKTISNMTVATDSDYTGIFGYTGAGFSLSDISIDDTVSVQSTADYVGSIVGYNRGLINNVISTATVGGNSYVGGIVGYSENRTAIKNTVFFGVLPNGGYGITGQSSNTVTVDTTGSLYAVICNEFVEAGKENYSHNDYGNVVYIDRGIGYVQFVGEEIIFSVVGNPGNSGLAKIMTGQDAVRKQDATTFDLTDVGNTGVAQKFYVRFTFEVTLGLADMDTVLLNSDNYGQGYYYDGQEVRFSLELKPNYFLFLESGMPGYTFTASGDKVAIDFTLDILGGTQSPEMSVVDFSSSVIPEGTISYDYDGTAKSVEITYGGIEANFAPFVYKFFDSEGNGVESIVDSGSYSVKIALVDTDGRYLGYAYLTDKVMVNKKVITVSDGEYWAEYAEKDYDGTATMTGKPIDPSILTGADGVTVSATVTWSGSDQGHYTDVTVNNFVTDNENYTVEERTITTNGTINTREVTVTVDSDNLTVIYDEGNAPIITGYVYSYAMDQSDVEVTYNKLLGDTAEDDTDWDGEYTVGRYEIILISLNGNLSLSYSDIVFVIVPKTIDDVSYSTGLVVYDGAAKNGEIKGVYYGSNGGVNYVAFRFENIAGEEVSEVINAGEYRAYPYIENENYVLSDTVEPLSFSVDKAPAPTVTFSVADTVTVGVDSELTEIEGITADMTLTVESSDSRGKAIIVEEEGVYYLSVVAYPFGGTMTFSIRTESSNYYDGLSEEKTITVLPGTIYVGLKDREFTFGEVIVHELVFSTDKEQNETISTDSIAGFVSPTLETSSSVHVDTYRASIFGGQSDGYEFVVVNDTYVINKRTIRISIADELNKGKVYGEKDGDIPYVITNESGEYIDTLPDGREIELVGKLSRSAGENVGFYAINLGTMTAENNPDYDIDARLSGKLYEISSRHVSLVVDAGRKQYGQIDPAFTFSMAEGSSYAEGDTAASLNVVVSREEGEDVGYYEYIVESYNGGRNYIVDSVDVKTNRFLIEKAVPNIACYTNMINVHYGDRLGKHTLSGDATTDSGRLGGNFYWVSPDTVVNNIGEHFFEYDFVPNDADNYASVRGVVVIDVLPRIAEVRLDGDIHYTYNGKVQGTNIKATVVNALEGDTFDVTYEYSNEQSIDVGRYTVAVTDLGNDRYVLDPKETVDGKIVGEYVIQRATVTVTVSGGTVDQGEKFSPKITYDGLIGGEKELSKKATVDIPTVPGVHSIIAKGAEGDNYSFVYVPAELIIKILSVESEGLVMYGDLGTNFSMTATYLEDNSLSNAEMLLNKGMKYNFIMPNTHAVKHYMGVEYNGTVEGEFLYTLTLAEDMEFDKIVVRYADGSYKELEYDPEIGISIECEQQIIGIAFLSAKDTATLLKGFAPLIAIGVVVLVAIGLAIGSIRRRRKKDHADREFLSRYDR